MMLLTADLHLTDAPQDNYRWDTFDAIEACLRKSGTRDLYILGDLTDRRDRHSGRLINGIMQRLRQFGRRGVTTTILMGNHDAPMHGAPYWHFLSDVPYASYISTPTARDNLLLLPATATPAADWRDIPLDRYRAVFMHQTINGAMFNGIRARDCTTPMLPRHLRVYSGDVHVPQQVGSNVVYVGAPHPKNFGDDHACRLLLLDAAYTIAESVQLRPPRKHAVELHSVTDLSKLPVKPGDQARIVFHLDPARVEQWPVDHEAIIEWAKHHSVRLAGVEGIVELPAGQRSAGQHAHTAAPGDVLREFAAAEGLDDITMAFGLQLLKDAAMNGRQ